MVHRIKESLVFCVLFSYFFVPALAKDLNHKKVYLRQRRLNKPAKINDIYQIESKSIEDPSDVTDGDDSNGYVAKSLVAVESENESTEKPNSTFSHLNSTIDFSAAAPMKSKIQLSSTIPEAPISNYPVPSPVDIQIGSTDSTIISSAPGKTKKGSTDSEHKYIDPPTFNIVTAPIDPSINVTAPVEIESGSNNSTIISTTPVESEIAATTDSELEFTGSNITTDTAVSVENEIGSTTESTVKPFVESEIGSTDPAIVAPGESEFGSNTDSDTLTYTIADSSQIGDAIIDDPIPSSNKISTTKPSDIKDVEKFFNELEKDDGENPSLNVKPSDIIDVGKLKEDDNENPSLNEVITTKPSDVINVGEFEDFGEEDDDEGILNYDDDEGILNYNQDKTINLYDDDELNVDDYFDDQKAAILFDDDKFDDDDYDNVQEFSTGVDSGVYDNIDDNDVDKSNKVNLYALVNESNDDNDENSEKDSQVLYLGAAFFIFMSLLLFTILQFQNNPNGIWASFIRIIFIILSFIFNVLVICFSFIFRCGSSPRQAGSRNSDMEMLVRR